MANNAPDSSAADPAIQIFGIAGLFEMCHSMIEIFAGGGGGGGLVPLVFRNRAASLRYSRRHSRSGWLFKATVVCASVD